MSRDQEEARRSKRSVGLPPEFGPLEDTPRSRKEKSEVKKLKEKKLARLAQSEEQQTKKKKSASRSTSKEAEVEEIKSKEQSKQKVKLSSTLQKSFDDLKETVKSPAFKLRTKRTESHSKERSSSSRRKESPPRSESRESRSKSREEARGVTPDPARSSKEKVIGTAVEVSKPTPAPRKSKTFTKPSTTTTEAEFHRSYGEPASGVKVESGRSRLDQEHSRLYPQGIRPPSDTSTGGVVPERYMLPRPYSTPQGETSERYTLTRPHSTPQRDTSERSRIEFGTEDISPVVINQGTGTVKYSKTADTQPRSTESSGATGSTESQESVGTHKLNLQLTPTPPSGSAGAVVEAEARFDQRTQAARATLSQSVGTSLSTESGIVTPIQVLKTPEGDWITKRPGEQLPRGTSLNQGDLEAFTESGITGPEPSTQTGTSSSSGATVELDVRGSGAGSASQSYQDYWGDGAQQDSIQTQVLSADTGELESFFNPDIFNQTLTGPSLSRYQSYPPLTTATHPRALPANRSLPLPPRVLQQEQRISTEKALDLLPGTQIDIGLILRQSEERRRHAIEAGERDIAEVTGRAWHRLRQQEAKLQTEYQERINQLQNNYEAEIKSEKARYDTFLEEIKEKTEKEKERVSAEQQEQLENLVAESLIKVNSRQKEINSITQAQIEKYHDKANRLLTNRQLEIEKQLTERLGENWEEKLREEIENIIKEQEQRAKDKKKEIKRVSDQEVADFKRKYILANNKGLENYKEDHDRQVKQKKEEFGRAIRNHLEQFRLEEESRQRFEEEKIKRETDEKIRSGEEKLLEIQKRHRFEIDTLIVVENQKLADAEEHHKKRCKKERDESDARFQDESNEYRRSEREELVKRKEYWDEKLSREFAEFTKNKEEQVAKKKAEFKDKIKKEFAEYVQELADQAEKRKKETTEELNQEIEEHQNREENRVKNRAQATKELALAYGAVRTKLESIQWLREHYEERFEEVKKERARSLVRLHKLYDLELEKHKQRSRGDEQSVEEFKKRFEEELISCRRRGQELRSEQLAGEGVVEEVSFSHLWPIPPHGSTAETPSKGTYLRALHRRELDPECARYISEFNEWNNARLASGLPTIDLEELASTISTISEISSADLDAIEDTPLIDIWPSTHYRTPAPEASGTRPDPDSWDISLTETEELTRRAILGHQRAQAPKAKSTDSKRGEEITSQEGESDHSDTPVRVSKCFKGQKSKSSLRTTTQGTVTHGLERLSLDSEEEGSSEDLPISPTFSPTTGRGRVRFEEDDSPKEGGGLIGAIAPHTSPVKEEEESSEASTVEYPDPDSEEGETTKKEVKPRLSRDPDTVTTPPELETESEEEKDLTEPANQSHRDTTEDTQTSGSTDSSVRSSTLGTTAELGAEASKLFDELAKEKDENMEQTLKVLQEVLLDTKKDQLEIQERLTQITGKIGGEDVGEKVEEALTKIRDNDQRRINNLPSFDPDKDEVEEFLIKFTDIMDLHNERVDRRVGQLKICCQGPARTFIDTLLKKEDYEPKNDLFTLSWLETQVLDEIKKRYTQYDDWTASSLMKNELKRADESIDKYYNRLTKKCDNLGYTEREKVTTFCDGLPTAWRQYIISHIPKTAPATLEGVYKIAKTCQSVISMGDEEARRGLMAALPGNTPIGMIAPGDIYSGLQTFPAVNPRAVGGVSQNVGKLAKGLIEVCEKVEEQSQEQEKLKLGLETAKKQIGKKPPDKKFSNFGTSGGSENPTWRDRSSRANYEALPPNRPLYCIICNIPGHDANGCRKLAGLLLQQRSGGPAFGQGNGGYPGNNSSNGNFQNPGSGPRFYNNQNQGNGWRGRSPRPPWNGPRNDYRPYNQQQGQGPARSSSQPPPQQRGNRYDSSAAQGNLNG